MKDIPDGWAERAAAVLRSWYESQDAYDRAYFNGNGIAFEELVLELPKPIDPLLLRAREIAAEVHDEQYANDEWAENYISGQCDNYLNVQSALRALQQGAKA
jgi:hypothetical protein